MKNQKPTNLNFTINIKKFSNDDEIINHLLKAIKTSLDLNRDDKFLQDMKDADEINLSLKKNLKVKIKDCDCNK